MVEGFFRLGDRHGPPLGSFADAAPAFVELTPPSLAIAGGCVIEFEKASGTKMRIELRGSQLPELAALSRSFWETR